MAHANNNDFMLCVMSRICKLSSMQNAVRHSLAFHDVICYSLLKAKAFLPIVMKIIGVEVIVCICIIIAGFVVCSRRQTD